MTQLTIGSSVTVRVGDMGTVPVASNGGFFSYSGTTGLGVAFSRSYGPDPIRHIIGPFKEGATVTLTNASVNWLDYDALPIDLASVSGGGVSSVRPVATRMRAPSTTSATAIQIESMVVHVATDRITRPQLEYQNWFNTDETNGPAGGQVECAIEYPIGSGNWTRVTFAGASFGAYPQNGYLLSDRNTLVVPIPKGGRFRVHSNLVASATAQWPVHRGGMQPQFGVAAGDACHYSTSTFSANVMSGTMAGTAGDSLGITFGPCTIEDDSSQEVVGIVGDSVQTDSGSFVVNTDMNAGQGIIARALQGRLTCVNLSVSGDSYANVVPVASGGLGKAYALRKRLADKCTAFIFALGRNDVNITAANLSAFSAAHKAQIAPNKPVYLDTYAPYTNAVNFGLALADQTIDPGKTNLIVCNAAIRRGQVGSHIEGYIDTAAGAESSQGSGKWRIDLHRVVYDGQTGAANTGASNIMKSATANFTEADIGKPLMSYQRIAVSGIVWAANVATVTTTAPHGLSSGTYAIGGATPSGYNSVLKTGNNSGVSMTVTGATTLQFALTTDPGGSAGACYLFRRCDANAVINVVNAADSVTCVNNTGGFSSIPAATGCMFLINYPSNDWLHQMPGVEVEMAKLENIKTLPLLTR